MAKTSPTNFSKNFVWRAPDGVIWNSIPFCASNGFLSQIQQWCCSLHSLLPHGPVPEGECHEHTKWDYKCAVKTFFVTLLRDSSQVQHESSSDQHSVYWPIISLTLLMWCCPMVFTVLLSNGVYCTAVQWCLLYCCTMVITVLLYNGGYHIAVQWWLLYCCTMVITVLLYNGDYYTAVQWWLLYCCTMVITILLYNGDYCTAVQ